VRPRIRKLPSAQSQSTTELPWRPVAAQTATIGRESVKGFTGGIGVNWVDFVLALLFTLRKFTTKKKERKETSLVSGCGALQTG
jgi:hypothetical protein